VDFSCVFLISASSSFKPFLLLVPRVRQRVEDIRMGKDFLGLPLLFPLDNNTQNTYEDFFLLVLQMGLLYDPMSKSIFKIPSL